MNGGYIKLHRSLLEWEWFDDEPTLRAFLYLLLTANYETTRYMGHDIMPGERVTGYPTLAKQLGYSVQSVRTAIKRLKSTGEITVKTTNKFSIIRIENWEKYQNGNSQNNSQTNSQLTVNQQATNSQLTTSKEYKNIRNREYINTPLYPPKGENDDFSFDDLFKEKELPPPPARRTPSQTETNKALLDNSNLSEEVKKAVMEWVHYKGGYKTSYFQKLITQIKGAVAHFGDEAVINAIDNSIVNQYKGFTWSLKPTNQKPKLSISDRSNLMQEAIRMTRVCAVQKQ